MSGHAEVSGSEIRARLDHPVIDADGHTIECEWLLDEYVREVAGPAIHARWLKRPAPYGPTKMIWWGYPSGATPPTARCRCSRNISPRGWKSAASTSRTC